MQIEREVYDMVKRSVTRLYGISRQEEIDRHVDPCAWLDIGILCGFVMNALAEAEIQEVDPAEILRNLK